MSLCKEIHWEREEEGKRGEMENISVREGAIDTTRILTQKNLDNKMSIFFPQMLKPYPSYLNFWLRFFQYQAS